MLLVTGGAGFIGSNLLASLEEAGRRGLVVVDRFRDGDKWKNVAKRDIADLVDPDDLFNWLDVNGEVVDAVLHMGAISSTTERDVDRIVDTNVRLSRALWHWCTENQTRFIYASSAATYGDGAQGFRDGFDALPSYRPLNPYGWSKHLFDRMVAAEVSAGHATPPQWAGLKFFNVYGPNEYHKGEMKSVVAKLYPQLRAGEPARLFKSYPEGVPDGGQRRDFVWVGDCVAIVRWLLDNEQVSGLFNVGSGRARSFADLAAATARAARIEPRIEFIEMPEAIRDKYQYFTEADLSDLRAAGWRGETTSLEDGIAMYVQAFLAAADPYR
jgi:ADP-L-glycero-D-manno-heptose 6-epimerase